MEVLCDMVVNILSILRVLLCCRFLRPIEFFSTYFLLLMCEFRMGGWISRFSEFLALKDTLQWCGVVLCCMEFVLIF